MDGIDRVYERPFDRAREYIPRPKPGDCWEYAQYVISLEQIDNVMLGGIYKSDVDEFVGLRFFNTAFFVDLLTVGRLRPFIIAHQPEGTVMVGPDFVTKAQTRAVGHKRYRLTIELENSGGASPPASRIADEGRIK